MDAKEVSFRTTRGAGSWEREGENEGMGIGEVSSNP